MTSVPIVAVRGEAVREADPELASFRVSVRAQHADRAKALSLLTARHDTIRTMLDRYAEAVEQRETSHVSVYPRAKRSGERVQAYVGSLDTTVTVCDFTVLGELLLKFIDIDQVSVSGPWWSLRPTSPVYREARRAAVDEAITRAREYAEALGAHLTRLVQLSDPGVDSFAAQTLGFSMPRGGAGVDTAAVQLELDPQRQTVRAAVEARFEISEPASLG